MSTSTTSVIRHDRLGPVHTDRSRSDVGFFCEETPEGFLRTSGRLTRTGVFLYGDAEGNEWGELRTPEEVFDPESMASFEMVVITDDHPETMVSSENVKDVQKGSVGSDVHREGDYLAASLLFTDSQVIRSIRDGKVELSCGYMAQVVAEEGSLDGIPYSGRQTKIRGNHLALVDAGRAGPECRVFCDATEVTHAFSIEKVLDMSKDQKINKKSDAIVMIEGEEHEVPEAVAMAMKAMEEKIMEQGAELSKLSMEEEEKPMEESKDPTMDALRAKVDSLQALLEKSQKDSHIKIDARVKLLTQAQSILGETYSCDGMSDTDIMRQVVAHCTPAMASKVDKASDDYVRAAYDMAIQTQSMKIDSSMDLLTLTTPVPTSKGDSNQDIDALYTDFVSGLRTRSFARIAKESN